jgi:glutamine amidotransferase
MIALIDYGSGNLRSVEKALVHIGAQVKLVDSADKLEEHDAVVLPGVGAFGDCANNLRSRGLWEPMQEWLQSGRPFLGVCVGYQLLFEGSEENPGVAGFGFFPGQVRRFSTPDLKIPQIGWNTLETQPSPLWKGLPKDPFVFFVHSFFPSPTDPSVVSATTEYGVSFAAAASKGNVHGVQFHPEKSQANGLRILQNFVESV